MTAEHSKASSWNRDTHCDEHTNNPAMTAEHSVTGPVASSPRWQDPRPSRMSARPPAP